MKTATKLLLAVTALSFLLSTALLAGDWTSIYEGVEYQTATKTSPRPMKAYALRIDLKNPNVSFYATPSNGGSPYETNMQTTPTFRSTYGLEAAINANFFVPHSPYTDVRGALVSNGTLVSGHESSYPTQLRINSSKVADIVAASGNPSGMHTVVSGDAYHLVGGVCLGANDVARARTSVGVSQDGRFLIMCVVDEGQSNSQGATILDMSYWMKDFGAWDAMNLDGGGSSCICTASGGVLNHPSDGSPRSVGANLGVNTSANASRLDVFFRGTDNNIYQKRWTNSGGWASSSSIGAPAGGATSDPTSVSRHPGQISVFVRGTDGQVYSRWYSDGAWNSSGWVSRGGSIVGAPDACSWNQDRLDVFARGTNDHLYQLTWTESGGWGAWTDRGGALASDPTAVCMEPGRISVFARGVSGDLIHKYYNAGWSDWVSRGGTIVDSPDAVSQAAGNLSVFARWTDNTCRQIYYTNENGWSSWTDRGGNISSGTGAGSYAEGYVNVFARGSTGELYTMYYTTGSGWSGWSSMGTTQIVGGPDACSWSNDTGLR